jgi:hypothetical protein
MDILDEWVCHFQTGQPKIPHVCLSCVIDLHDHVLDIIVILKLWMSCMCCLLGLDVWVSKSRPMFMPICWHVFWGQNLLGSLLYQSFSEEDNAPDAPSVMLAL